MRPWFPFWPRSPWRPGNPGCVFCRVPVSNAGSSEKKKHKTLAPYVSLGSFDPAQQLSHQSLGSQGSTTRAETTPPTKKKKSKTGSWSLEQVHPLLARFTLLLLTECLPCSRHWTRPWGYRNDQGSFSNSAIPMSVPESPLRTKKEMDAKCSGHGI